MKKESIYYKYTKKRRVIISLSVAILVLLYTFKNASFLIRSLSAIVLLLVFYLADHFFDLDFREKHYAFVIIIAISSFLLSNLYYIYPQYDKIQHFIMPMMFASIAFHMISRLDLKLKWKVVFVFFIVVGSVGLFEIGEYVLDYFFDLKLQGVFLRDIQGLGKLNLLQDRIDDTMVDMFLGLIGASIYSLILYLWLKKKKPSTP